MRRLRLLVTLLAVAEGVFLFPSRAGALEVLSPYVNHEIEFEQQGYVAHDRNADANNAQGYVASVGFSPLSFYRLELEAEFTRDPGSDHEVRYSSFNIENTFALTEPGEYWLDSGLFYEMDYARSAPNTIILGYIGAKEAGPFLDTFNFLAHKDYSNGETPLGFIYSNQLRYHYRPYLEPGFEIFGDTAGKAKFDDQQLAIGPGIYGKIYAADGQAFKYQLGYLFGANTVTPDGAIRWKMEYEFSF